VAWLRLTKGEYDLEVRKHSRDVCEQSAGEFLLRYWTAEELCLWVCDCALDIVRDPRSSNDFRRLRLQPFNVVGPLELARVYAAYLGRMRMPACCRRQRSRAQLTTALIPPGFPASLPASLFHPSSWSGSDIG
jgi:hypothetical protein